MTFFLNVLCMTLPDRQMDTSDHVNLLQFAIHSSSIFKLPCTESSILPAGNSIPLLHTYMVLKFFSYVAQFYILILNHFSTQS